MANWFRNLHLGQVFVGSEVVSSLPGNPFPGWDNFSEASPVGSRGLNLDKITVKIFKFFPCGPEHLDGVDILNKSILFEQIHIQIGLSKFTNDFSVNFFYC